MATKDLTQPSAFEKEYMSHFGGMNKIDQGFFRFFLRWLDGALAKSSNGMQGGFGISVQNTGDIPIVSVDLSQLIDDVTIVLDNGKIKSTGRVSIVLDGGLKYASGDGEVVLDIEKAPADILDIGEDDEVNDNSVVTYLTLSNFFEYLKVALTENAYWEKKSETIGEGVEAETHDYLEIKTRTLDETERLVGCVWYDKETHCLIFAPSKDEDEDKRVCFSLAAYEDLDELRHENLSTQEVDDIFDEVFAEP